MMTSNHFYYSTQVGGSATYSPPSHLPSGNPNELYETIPDGDTTPATASEVIYNTLDNGDPEILDDVTTSGSNKRVTTDGLPDLPASPTTIEESSHSDLKVCLETEN